MLRMACPQCGKSLDFKPEHIGRRGCCEHCNSRFTIRSEEAQAQSKHGTDTPILKKLTEKCPECLKVQTGYYTPEGKFICPQCSPAAVYQRWHIEWENAQIKDGALKVLDSSGRFLWKLLKAIFLSPFTFLGYLVALLRKRRKKALEAKALQRVELHESKLVSCPDCNHKVSRNARSCPNCGNVLAKEPVEPHQEQSSALGVLGAIGAVVFLLAIFGSSGSGSNSSGSASSRCDHCGAMTPTSSLRETGAGWGKCCPSCQREYADMVEGVQRWKHINGYR